MDLSEAIKIVYHHQQWRLGRMDDMVSPKDLTEALDEILDAAGKQLGIEH